MGSQGAYFEGDRGIIVLCTMFLVFSSVNVSIFPITWLDTFWTDLIFLMKLVLKRISTIFGGDEVYNHSCG